MSDLHSDRDDRLAQLLSEALHSYRSQRTPDVARWQARHPDVAGELPDLLDMMRHLDSAASDWQSVASPETRVQLPPTVEAGSTASRSPSPLPERISRYRVLGLLGEGGMGTVYRAEDPQLRRVVALKVPRFDGPEGLRAAAIKRFQREARAAAQIHHPNVCPIHDVGTHEGMPFVVMDYVEGESLAARLATGGQFAEPAEAVALALQVTAALEAVHSQGVIHRDLKPGNILLDALGKAVLTDFGLARWEQDADSLTGEGALVGTPAYMAPEQVSLTEGKVGPWSDVYSLGAVLYEVLTGRRPFQAPVLQMLYAIVHEPPPPPCQLRPSLDPALQAIVQRAMARRPADRYATAGDFATALRHWSAGEVAPASPAPSPSGPAACPGDDRRRRRRWLLAVGGALAAVVLGLVAGGYYLAPLILRQQPAQEDAVSEALGMGSNLAGQGKWEQAATAYDRALVLAEQRDGKDGLRTAEVLFAAGEFYDRQREPGRARACYQRCLELREARLGSDHPDLAAVLDRLAEGIVGDDPERALSLLRRSLRIREGLPGEDVNRVLATLDRLGELCMTTRRHDEAEGYFQRGLALRKDRIGPNDPSVAATLDNLAWVYETKGQDQAAEAALRDRLDILEAIHGANHPDVLRCRQRLRLLTRQQSVRRIARSEPAGTKLELELLQHAPEILQFLREHRYHSVGTLNFLVEKDGWVSDNAGPLNVNLAKRLETALLLKYDMKADRDLTLLHQASVAAARVPGGDYLARAGRTRLFEGRYRPLWGKQTQVEADCFLTGRAVFSEDLRSVAVTVSAFGRDAAVRRVTAFQASSNLNLLVEAGESFQLGVAPKSAGPFPPGFDPREPVALEIHYVNQGTKEDRLIIPEVTDDGRIRVPVTAPDQVPYFLLKRKDTSNARFGVVLMVNGFNTLFEERRTPREATKWILEPGAAPVKIDGYVVKDRSGQQKVPFTLRYLTASGPEPAQSAAPVGTISFTVFREQAEAVDRTPANGALEKRAEAAVSNPPAPPAEPAADAGAVKQKVEGSAENLLQLLERGEAGYGVQAEPVRFTNPHLVSTVTIRVQPPP